LFVLTLSVFAQSIECTNGKVIGVSDGDTITVLCASENKNISYYPQAGFIRIGFTHAFRHLLLGSSYEEAITETLLGGGDTDTNACIVGGLIGAACGAETIPDFTKLPVLNCDTTQGQNRRPESFNPKQIPTLVERIL
jgi:ADP-ribosyl-[dinitrogen reductase] hydrolase